MKLSDEQICTLKYDVEIVSACPGAGKTRAIVARFSQTADAANKGVALLSFTNAAVDEIVTRIGSIGKFNPPHFVGTFDRFVHQFIVTPFVLRTAHIKPRYVDSWMELAGSDWLYLRDRGVPGKGIPLTDFIPDADGVLSFSASPSEDGRIYARQLDAAGISLDGIMARANDRIEELLAKHIYDCDHARILGLQILEGTVPDVAPQRISLRFSEIIVDEFQDCSDIEYRIREQLKVLGVKVVVVADADQGIYEFRNAKPQMFSALVANSPREAVLELNDNYRSSKAICALVTSLRSLSSEAVVAARTPDPGSTPSKIFVLVGSNSYKVSQFKTILEEYGLPSGNATVLAPTRKQAAQLAGHTAAKFEKCNGSTGKLLRILAHLRHGVSPRDRSRAPIEFTNLVLSLFDWTQVGLEMGTVEEKTEHLGLQQAALRLSLSSLVRGSAEWTSRDDAKQAIQLAIGRLTANLSLEPSSVTMKFQKPREADWKSWIAVGLSAPAEIAHRHIHEVKGKEFPGVLLEVPHAKRNGVDSGLTSWLEGVDSEPRRVLYVGASRAQRLLALSVARTRIDDLEAVLHRDGVPYELRSE